MREIKVKSTWVLIWCVRKMKRNWELIIMVLAIRVRKGRIKFMEPARGLLRPLLLEIKFQVLVREWNLGLTLFTRKGKTALVLVVTGWNVRREVKLLPPFEASILYHQLVMNIIVWNSKGALKPNFQRHVRELVRNYNPDIMVIMETRIGGDRARR